jgi:hypothetical protein
MSTQEIHFNSFHPYFFNHSPIKNVQKEGEKIEMSLDKIKESEESSSIEESLIPTTNDVTSILQHAIQLVTPVKEKRKPDSLMHTPDSQIIESYPRLKNERSPIELSLSNSPSSLLSKNTTPQKIMYPTSTDSSSILFHAMNLPTPEKEKRKPDSLMNTPDSQIIESFPSLNNKISPKELSLSNSPSSLLSKNTTIFQTSADIPTVSDSISVLFHASTMITPTKTKKLVIDFDSPASPSTQEFYGSKREGASPQMINKTRPKMISSLDRREESPKQLETTPTTSESYSSPIRVKSKTRRRIPISSTLDYTTAEKQGIKTRLISAKEGKKLAAQEKQREKTEEIFSGILPTAKDQFFKLPKKLSFDPQKVYFLDGQAHNIVKQKKSNSCGASALLMLYTDIVRNGLVSYSLDDEFWTWYKGCGLTNRFQLVEIAEKHLKLKQVNLELSFEKLSNVDDNENIRTIAKHIKTFGLPVISSITHPKIEGHWIVVDAVKKEHIYIRDPFTGAAYAISRQDMDIYIALKIEYVLYVKAIK